MNLIWSFITTVRCGFDCKGTQHFLNIAPFVTLATLSTLATFTTLATLSTLATFTTLALEFRELFLMKS